MFIVYTWAHICTFWQIVATVVLNIYDDGDAATGDDGDTVRIVST
jgi:hypothetical protein